MVRLMGQEKGGVQHFLREEITNNKGRVGFVEETVQYGGSKRNHLWRRAEVEWLFFRRSLNLGGQSDRCLPFLSCCSCSSSCLLLLCNNRVL